MSMFLPEGEKQPSTGVSLATPANPTVSDEDLALAQRVFAAIAARPTLIPETVMAYLFDFLQTSPLQIPIGRVPGFSQFTAQAAAQVATNESRSLSVYDNLATVGPQLSSLPDGSYLLLYGSVAAGVAGTTAAIQSIEVNGVAAVDTDACQNSGSSQCSIVMATVKQLANGGDNSVVCKFRSTDNTTASSFARRWLVGLKYSN